MADPAPGRQKTLLVRADGGASQGLGHLVRCLALVQAWRGLGGHAVFAVSPELVTPLNLLAVPREIPEIIRAPTGTEADAREVASIAKRLQPDWILVDGYRFDPDYRALLREHAPLALVDDSGDLTPYRADVLINQNIYADAELYSAPANVIGAFLLGPRHALLRSQFRDLRQHRRQSANRTARLVVALGGGRARDPLEVVLEALDHIPVGRLDATIVTGPADPDWKEIQRAAAGRAAHVIRGGSHLPMLLADADLSITSAGSISWELCCLGVPALLLILSEDQRRIAEALHALGSAVNLGYTAHLSLRSCAEHILALLDDPQRRQSMRRIGRKLVDGHGAERCAQALWDAAAGSV